MADVEIQRLQPGDGEIARRTFTALADLFEESGGVLDVAQSEAVLASPSFWAYSATVGGTVVGGLTAHTLPMTSSASSEVFLYDLGVHPEHQRRGIGAALVRRLRIDAAAVGIDVIFVPADNDDQHALDFYRSLGGAPAPVTIFTFKRPGRA